MGKSLVVTSGKGGVGKTTVVANVGTGLAMKGLKVVLVDTDIGLRNLDLLLGLENRIVYNIIDVVEGRCDITQALVKDKRFSNLYLLPAAQTREKEAISTDQMKAIVDELKKIFDFVLIDSPAGIEHGFKTAIWGADEAIVVTTPEVSAVRDADRVIGLLEANGLKDPSLIANRVRFDMVKNGEMLSVEDLLEILSIDLLGIIPEDENLIISVNKGEPIILGADKYKSGLAFNLIVKKLLGEEVSWNELEKTENFIEKVFKFLRG
ncbi:MAG TPA: septum site-determining protein MinD [Dictyoglomaceae bacterium]|nr:septum site-determining protein MinD [Dictyoglomaceae bacterium]HOL39630.1 septum site-determining protein MinD [Dictyoglomaceae bacterium]HOP95148.1 septum site-determining protein MinD [Dictyoglomaceae bacterium]HPP15202.1 septum site-determining protein MinD [Dictyoglomaceae bacterium]HPU42608.1 septum site-determining protein MinD [Dictyoglomaceae bacterium]